jgi:SAM-dependent methyltransferase
MQEEYTTQSEHWERHAEAWVRWARKPGHDTYWRFHRDRFLELVPPPGRLTVDVGCGEGRLARHLKALGHRVVAVDSSPTMVRHTREADSELDVHEAEMTALPFEDGAADVAIAFMSLMNVDRLADAVREVGRVVAPGGRFCLAITHTINTAGDFESLAPDARFVIERSYFEHAAVETAAERDGLTMTFLDNHRPLEEYVDALADGGFLIERLREVTDTEGRWRRVPLFLDLRAVRS